MNSGNKQNGLNTPADSPTKFKKAELVNKKILKESKDAKNKKTRNYNPNDEFLDSEDEDNLEHSYLNKDAEKKRIKIEKFEISSRPKAYQNIVRVCLVCLIFIAISFADYLVNKNSQEDLKWLLDNQKSLIDLQGSVNYAYASIYEGIALKQGDFQVGGVEIMNFHLTGVADNKRDLINYLERDYPNQLNDYTESLKSFMFNDMCDNYFKNIRSSKNQLLTLLKLSNPKISNL